MAQQEEQGTPKWTQKLEDLLDDGEIGEAQKLLEGIVADLEKREASSANLTLSAALFDLASLYNSQGLSIKADSCFSSALLIKKRAEELADFRVRDSPSVDCGIRTKEEESNTIDVQGRQVRDSPSVDCGNRTKEEENTTIDVQGRHSEPSDSGSTCEEEWESALSEGLLKLGTLSTSSKTLTEVSAHDRSTYKQRGRGAFTYGEMGMRCDRPVSSPNESLDMEDESDMGYAKAVCGVRHVLMVTFSPKVTTKDLEKLFEAFALRNGVTIRWVNDTTALAVFRNPEFAREALQSVNNPEFKLEELNEDSELLGLVNKQDLQPPVPRPATSSQAAHRMIMGALRRQGIDNKSVPRNKFQSSQKQESDRKERLLMRQKLRDEAWGEDG